MATYEIDTLKDGAGNVYHLNPYTLPIASATVLGAIKVGSGLSIDSTTGVLSASGLGTETDPVFTASPAHGITSTDITNWNSAYAHGVTNKGSAFTSGLYKITTNSEGHVTAATSVGKSDITNLGIPAQDTTYSAFVGASSSAAGDEGLVPIPYSGYQNKVLFGNGVWDDILLVPAYSASEVDISLRRSDVILGDELGIAEIPAASSSSAGVMSASDKSKLDRIGNTWYGTSSTGASTAAKVVTCSNFALVAGATISILFSTANTAATPTLNVNSTGAKSIYVGSSTPSSTTNVLKWSANTLLTFIYDGTYFRYISSVSAGTVEPSRGANVWYGTCSTAAGTAAKTSTINNFVLTKGAVVVLQMTTANTVTASAITLNINSTGAKTIYVYNTSSSVNALTWDVGDILTFVYDGTYWRYQSRGLKEFIGNTSASVGKDGLVPGPPSGGIRFLLSDGEWYYPRFTSAIVPSTNTYRVYSGYSSTSSGDIEVFENIDIPLATQSALGLMSAADKTKLDSVNSDVNVTTDFETADSTWANLIATSYRMIASGSLITIEVQGLTTASATQITMPYSANCYSFTVCGSIASNDPVVHAVVAVSGTTLYLPEVSGASFTLTFRSATQIVPSGGSASGGASYTKTNATLPTSGWSNNSITVNVTGVTASNDVIVAPAPASAAAWVAAGIVCTSQGAGTLTFTRTAANTAALTANVMVLTQG